VIIISGFKLSRIKFLYTYFIFIFFFIRKQFWDINFHLFSNFTVCNFIFCSFIFLFNLLYRLFSGKLRASLFGVLRFDFVPCLVKLSMKLLRNICLTDINCFFIVVSFKFYRTEDCNSASNRSNTFAICQCSIIVVLILIKLKIGYLLLTYNIIGLVVRLLIISINLCNFPKL